MTPRPVLRWTGSKHRLARRIVALMPPHRRFVDAFGGSGAVTMLKPRVPLEVYNDRFSDVVQFFRSLRADPERLAEWVRLTPISRDEFSEALQPCADDLEAARRFLVRSWFSFSSDGASSGGRRGAFNPRFIETHRAWLSLPERIRMAADRFRGVVIENRDALDVIRSFDGPETLHYVDPPYLLEDRQQAGPERSYACPFGESEWETLCATLRTIQGRAIVSAYDNPKLRAWLPGWEVVKFPALGQGANGGSVRRVECLFISPVVDR